MFFCGDINDVIGFEVEVERELRLFADHDSIHYTAPFNEERTGRRNHEGVDIRTRDARGSAHTRNRHLLAPYEGVVIKNHHVDSYGGVLIVFYPTINATFLYAHIDTKMVNYKVVD